MYKKILFSVLYFLTFNAQAWKDEWDNQSGLLSKATMSLVNAAAKYHHKCSEGCAGMVDSLKKMSVDGWQITEITDTCLQDRYDKKPTSTLIAVSFWIKIKNSGWFWNEEKLIGVSRKVRSDTTGPQILHYRNSKEPFPKYYAYDPLFKTSPNDTFVILGHQASCEPNPEWYFTNATKGAALAGVGLGAWLFWKKWQ